MLFGSHAAKLHDQNRVPYRREVMDPKEPNRTPIHAIRGFNLVRQFAISEATSNAT